MPSMKSRLRNPRSKAKSVERFATRQLEKYVRLHKKHEKELNYIG